MKPLILYENNYTVNDITKIKKNHPIWRVTDIFNQQLYELFDISFPYLINSKKYIQKKTEFIKKKSIKGNLITGNWIYLPWNGQLIHMVNEYDYFLLRTNRNKNLITADEQKKLYDACVGVIGLSVGSSSAINLVYQGIGRCLKLADFDSLDTTNLNRVRAGIHHIGAPKIEIVAQQLYEIDPYAQLYTFPEALSKKNLKDFFISKIKPQIILEAIDDFEMKIRLRLMAREMAIPVIMLTNLGDRVLIDIERYDLQKSLPLFNGLLGGLPEEILENPNKDKNKYAINIVGKENIPMRAIDSVVEINKSLVGRPQLLNTVTMSASLAAYLVRQILLGNNVISGRYLFDVDNIFMV